MARLWCLCVPLIFASSQREQPCLLLHGQIIPDRLHQLSPLTRLES